MKLSALLVLCQFAPNILYADTHITQVLSAPQKITLKEALVLARKSNPLLLQAKENIQQTESSILLTESHLYPTLSASASGERKQDISSSALQTRPSPYTAYGTGLHLSQPLFAKGMISAIESAEKDKKISQLNSEISERNLASDLIQAYYQIVLNTRAYNSLLRQKNIVEASLKTTEHRQQIGRSQLLDVLQVKTQIALLQSQVVDAQNSIDISNVNLSNFLGTPTQLYEIINQFNVPDLASVEKKIQPQQSRFFELEQNSLKILQINDQKDVLLGKYLPTLNLIGNYNFQNSKTSDLFQTKSNAWDAGIQLNIPLFSGFSYRHEKDILNSQRIQLEYASRDIENKNSVEIITDRKQLENAVENVLAGTEALNYAKDSSQEAIRQYKLATIDFLQFLSVQNAYVQAEQSLNTSKFNYLAALARYYSSLGKNMDDLIDLLEKTEQL